MRKLLVVALMSGAAAPAAAQQYDAGRVPEAPVGGPRIELRAGWAQDRVEVMYRDGTGTYRDAAGRSGFSYGAEAGYDLNLDGFGVIGAYVGAEDSTTRDCTEKFGIDRSCADTGRTFTVGLRGGYAFGRNSLLYVKGGYSNGQFKASYRDFTAPADSFTLSETVDGFHIGAGVEVGIGSQAYAKLEYLYTDFNGAEARSGNAFASVDPSRHQVVGGVGMRF